MCVLIACFCVLIISGDVKYLMKKVHEDMVYFYPSSTSAGSCCIPGGTEKYVVEDSQTKRYYGCNNCDSCTGNELASIGNDLKWLLSDEEEKLSLKNGIPEDYVNVYFVFYYIAGSCSQLKYALYNGTNGVSSICKNSVETFEVSIRSKDGCDDVNTYKYVTPCFPSKKCVDYDDCEEYAGKSLSFGSKCFSVDSRIIRKDGSEILLKHVEVGEKVLGYDFEEKKIVDTLVIDVVLHDFGEKIINVVKYEYSSDGRIGELYISDNHYLYFSSILDSADTIASEGLKLAEELKVGDYVILREGVGKIIEFSVGESAQGVVYTSIGNIFVDGVLASSYSVSNSKSSNFRISLELFLQRVWVKVLFVFVKYFKTKVNWLRKIVVFLVVNVYH